MCVYLHALYLRKGACFWQYHFLNIISWLITYHFTNKTFFEFVLLSSYIAPLTPDRMLRNKDVTVSDDALLKSGHGFTPGDRACLGHHPLVNTHDIFWLVKLILMLPDLIFDWYGREMYIKIWNCFNIHLIFHLKIHVLMTGLQSTNAVNWITCHTKLLLYFFIIVDDASIITWTKEVVWSRDVCGRAYWRLITS